MLTRGYFIGEIIDDLAILGGQVRMRNAVHIFDLTVAMENFFRDFLNILLSASFKNLNAARSNEPGLDLGDDIKAIGVQVTSSASSQKINETLKKITAEQTSKYTKFIVLGMNNRQRSYKIDPELATTHNFTESDVWDFATLAKKIVDLEVEKLQALYNFVRSNTARLKIELEVPDEEGNYPTTGYDLWEKHIAPRAGSGKAFSKFVADSGGDAPQPGQVEAALKALGNDLSRLPRLTREFLAMLFEMREKGHSKRHKDHWAHLLYGKVERLYRGDDLRGELEILDHAGFLRIDGEDPYENGPTEIGIRVCTDLEELQLDFVSYVEERKLGFRTVIGSMDFTAF